MIVLTIITGLLITICFCMAFVTRSLDRDFEHMKETIQFLKNENRAQKSKIGILEHRFTQMQEPEKIVIVHEYDDYKAPKYGGF